MYCRMVHEEIDKQRGLPHEEEEIPPPLLELNVSTYIPDKYIEDEGLKLEVYKRILCL